MNIRSLENALSRDAAFKDIVGEIGAVSPSVVG